MNLIYLSIAVLGLVTLWQFYYYFRYFLPVSRYKVENKSGNGHVPVSVIVVARNEISNLESNLESWLNQDYPDFEIVVVNNGSWDRSQEYLESMAELHPRLKIVKIVEQERYPKGKKFGLTLGIKAAKNEWLLLTDSDCRPGKNWIKFMSAGFKPDKSICLGYSPYTRNSSFVNFLIRFDTFYTAIQYFGFALSGKPYMGVGRNLAYTKSLFFKVKGFASHNHIMAGDDDLFINETATAANTTICLHPESFVESKPKASFDDWMKQKKRHLGVGKFYKSSDKRSLFGLHASNSLFFLALAFALYVSIPLYPLPYLWIPIGIYGLRLLVQYLVYGFAMKRLKETRLLYVLPFMDIFFLFFYPLMGFIASFQKTGKAKW